MSETGKSVPPHGARASIFEDPPVDLRRYQPEDWLAFALFWVLAGVVFLQFFSRYVVNDSVAWTEEIARYLLAMVAYLGGAMAVRRFSHIHVEFLYVYLPRGLARAFSTLVDLARIAFFAYGTYLGWKVSEIMHTQRMVIIDWPMSIVFGACTLGLGLMGLRAIQVAVRNWRAGTSPLMAVHEEGRHQ
jgi:TRAP-type C4-dicarboxylate transport system permease small subunit